MNPSEGAVGRRVAGIPDPNEYLLKRIFSRPNLSLAWRQVKANRGAPGVDNMAIDDFMAYAQEHWPEIRSSIFAGTYKPLPVKRVEIPKATGGTRPLGIPAVFVRLIQQAIAQVLFPIFDPGFFRRRVSDSARDCLLTMPCTWFAITSAKGIAWLWMQTWPSFSTRWSTTFL